MGKHGNRVIPPMGDKGSAGDKGKGIAGEPEQEMPLVTEGFVKVIVFWSYAIAGFAFGSLSGFVYVAWLHSPH